MTCAKKKFVTLRDGSTIKEVRKVWMTENFEAARPKNRFALIEALTSYNQVVICSSGVCDDNLGRAVTENEKKGDFHLLDYEPEMTEFVQISVDAHAAVGIDDDGELWILAGQQTYFSNLNLQSKDKQNV